MCKKLYNISLTVSSEIIYVRKAQAVHSFFRRSVLMSTAAITRPINKIGSKGQDVVDIQTALQNAGFSPGPIDGDFGIKTDQAVRYFQIDHHLQVDGIVGKDTWALLRNYSKPIEGPINTTPHMQEHIIKQNDTLYLLARLYKVDVEDIKKANPGIDPTNLPIGSTVKIPIDARGSVNPDPNAPIGPGIAPAGTIVYRVHHTQINRWKIKYDTIDNIANKFKITSAAIKDANPKININKLPKEGSVIFIPIARVPIPFEHVKITSNHQKVWNFFINKGFSEEATAGIMGNLQQESEMEPTKRQYNAGPGRGIGQWETHSDGKGRWDILKRRAHGQELDLNFQLEYILYELQETRWMKNFLDAFGGIENLMKMSIYQAIVAFEQSFELAGDPAFPRRFAFANIIYRRFARGVGRARA